MPIFAGESRWIGSVFLAPPVEETIKGFSVLVMAFPIPRAVPNRRYAAAAGAAAGLGYALSEDITYFVNPDISGISVALRLIHNPLGHPVFSALCAIGVFVFATRLRSGAGLVKSLIGVPLAAWIFAVLNHAFWNAWQFGPQPLLGYLGIPLSYLIIIVPFLLILRDLLGGHFNFGHFFEPIPEPAPPPHQMGPDLPPSPMPMQLSPRKKELERKQNGIFK